MPVYVGPCRQHRIFEFVMYALKSASDSAESQSPAHADLVYDKLMRLLDDLKALYSLPKPHAEAAATALRLQAQAQAADKRDRPAETKS